MKAAQQRGEDQGLSPEELAFYDALAENESAVDAMGSEQLGAYIQFSEMVARGCVGANEVLDQLIRECLDGFSIAAELSVDEPI